VVTQRNLRERFQAFIEETGTKQKFVSEKTDITQCVLSNFKRRKYDLYPTDTARLDQFLAERNY